MDNKVSRFRAENLAVLRQLRQSDVLILGGGVNGVAVLRDLALNGVSAVLLEQNDFCAGASGVSTRMAHGGLRYLENREFKLVAESARERNLLLKYAPHLTEPLKIILPLESRLSGFWQSALNFLGLGARRARPNLLAVKLALLVYEFFGRTHRSLPRHSTAMGIIDLPSNIKKTVKSYASYYDGSFVNPEGLIFEMLTEALEADSDCVALNHIEWKTSPDGSLEIYDPLCGEQFTVMPKVVVNATGAWLDETNNRLGVTTAYVSAVKGTHIVLRHNELLERLDNRAFYFDDGSGRMVICNPLGKTILMGTTETASLAPSQLCVEESEIRYLLRALSSLFDDIELDETHIVAAITGARPLRKSSTSDMYAARRNHAVLSVTPEHKQYPILSMTGGKWTTFRPFAEKAVDDVLARLGKPRVVSTMERSYLGTPSDDTVLPSEGDERSGMLYSRYGALWQEVATYCLEQPDAPLTAMSAYSVREIRWLIERRGAALLDDIILRRTTLAIDGLATKDVLEEIARILAETKNQTTSWAATEVERCEQMPAIRYRPSAATGDNKHAA
ncbi:MAG: glycerol-3-phosphate dehydrogenase/oxidase [Stappiaceae bacterium]